MAYYLSVLNEDGDDYIYNYEQNIEFAVGPKQTSHTSTTIAPKNHHPAHKLRLISPEPLTVSLGEPPNPNPQHKPTNLTLLRTSNP